jgi:hypothetical protein
MTKDLGKGPETMREWRELFLGHPLVGSSEGSHCSSRSR